MKIAKFIWSCAVGNRLYSFERRICNIFQSISVPKHYTLISSTVSYCSNLMIHISIHKPRSLGVPRYTYPARPFAASIFPLTSDWGSAISEGNTLNVPARTTITGVELFTSPLWARVSKASGKIVGSWTLGNEPLVLGFRNWTIHVYGIPPCDLE